MSNRRSFLQHAGIATAAAFLSPSILSSALAADKAAVNKVGLQLYTLRDLLLQDVKSVISKVAAIGYKQVETYYGYPGALAKEGFWGLDARAFKTLLNDNRLTSPAGHYNTNEFLSKDGSDETLKKNIETAAIVGQKYFVIPALPADVRKDGKADGYKSMAAKFNHAAELCKKHGLTLAYHNHNFEYGDLGGGITGYDILLTETDPAMVKFELDLFWAVNAGLNPIEMFRKNPGRYSMWHVKDMNKTDKSVFTEVGTGSIDFKSIFSQAKTSGLEYIFVEQDVIKKEPYQSITESFSYIKDVLLR